MELASTIDAYNVSAKCLVIIKQESKTSASNLLLCHIVHDLKLRNFSIFSYHPLHLLLNRARLLLGSSRLKSKSKVNFSANYNQCLCHFEKFCPSTDPIVLWSIALHCVVLRCTMLRNATLYSFVSFLIILDCDQPLSSGRHLEKRMTSYLRWNQSSDSTPPIPMSSLKMSVIGMPAYSSSWPLSSQILVMKDAGLRIRPSSCRG